MFIVESVEAYKSFAPEHLISNAYINDSTQAQRQWLAGMAWATQTFGKSRAKIIVGHPNCWRKQTPNGPLQLKIPTYGRAWCTYVTFISLHLHNAYCLTLVKKGTPCKNFSIALFGTLVSITYGVSQNLFTDVKLRYVCHHSVLGAHHLMLFFLHNSTISVICARIC